MRLPPQPREHIDRAQVVRFSFEGRPIEGYAGETVGSALFASGRRVFSRSFKYHRPRGLLCCAGNCPNCLMTVDGVPNVRVCVEPAREGARVSAQNVLGSLDRDLLNVVDRIGGPFTPVGFYYRTMIRPRWAWPLYERFLRNVAGLGRVQKDATRQRRFDTEHRHTQVLVIGGGRAGVAAAKAASENGEEVVLVDEGVDQLPAAAIRSPAIEVVAPARALGIYEGGLVPVDAGNVLLRFRAQRIVVATGAIEQPLVFPGNDLVGVMLPSAVRRLVRDWSLRPGERAVVITADQSGVTAATDLRDAGVDVAEVVRLRRSQPVEIVARGKRGRVRSVEIDGRSVGCDLIVMSGGRQPAYSLLAQAGARIEYDPVRGIFIPRDLPANVEAVGSVTGERSAASIPRPSFDGGSKSFVCICEDVTVKDVRRAIA
ncbi:MAG: (2Fe-2S)-binding protein, partial [Actinobacteria bacterium]|nr:(2Fe-2S)-binding protein [Actinomycetota bacterium]